jgi:acyl-[acyl carrier protein]--UDP-N-acetylglucosamine O-acyltransferase
MGIKHSSLFGMESTVALTSLNPGIQSNAIIRENMFVNTGSIIGHDIEVGSNSVLSSFVNVGGSCKVGKESLCWNGISDKRTLNDWVKYDHWYGIDCI